MDERDSISDLQQKIAQLQQRIAELEDRPSGATVDPVAAEAGNDILFRKIFEHSNDAILLIDPDLNETLDVNTRACDLLEYRRGELLTLPISVIFPNEHDAFAGVRPVSVAAGSRLDRRGRLPLANRTPG